MRNDSKKLSKCELHVPLSRLHFKDLILKESPHVSVQTRVPKAAHGHTVTQQTLAAVPLSIGGVLVKYMMPHSCTRLLCYSEKEKALLYMFVPVFGLLAPLKLPLIPLLSVSQERPPTPAHYHPRFPGLPAPVCVWPTGGSGSV